MYINIRVESVRDIVDRYELLVKPFKLKELEDPDYKLYNDQEYLKLSTIHNEFTKHLKKYELSKM